MLAPEIETRPWAEQSVIDDAHYRTQLDYLFERSQFYREKLKAAGFDSASAAGGLDDIARLPFTEKSEIRASCTPENPIGTHLCVDRSEIIRIYSTSGTTGTPSYIPLTAARSRQLGDHFGPELFGFRRGSRPAHRLHLQCRALRGRCGAWPPSTNWACAISPWAPATPSA